MGYPGIFPTGTTVYNKDKAWNGYTVFPPKKVFPLSSRPLRRLKCFSLIILQYSTFSRGVFP